MTKNMLKCLLDTTPRWNKELTDSPVYKILQKAPMYISDSIEASIRGMNNTKLKYLGFKVKTPRELYNSTMGRRYNDKAVYDLSRTDLVSVDYIFEYNQHRFMREQMLPFSSKKAGIMYISDTAYNIIGVMSDTVITVSAGEVFVKLNIDRIIVKKYNRLFMKDGERYNGYILHSTLYKTKTSVSDDNLGTAYPVITLYLLIRFGLSGIMNLLGCNDYIVTDESDMTPYMEDYTIYGVTGEKPRGIKDINYQGHSVKVLVRKSSLNEFNITGIESVALELLYALEVHPGTVDDVLETIRDKDVNSEKNVWKILLGRIIFKNSIGIDVLNKSITEHISILDGYLDEGIKKMLKTIDMDVPDFFYFLLVLLRKFSSLTGNSREYLDDMSNRYMDILSYILYDIYSSHNKTFFELNKKESNKTLSSQEIEKIFSEGNNFSSRSIYKILGGGGGGMNLSLSFGESVGESMYASYTKQLDDQCRGSGVRRGKKQSKFPLTLQSINGFDPYIGSLFVVSKSSPTSRLSLNPYMVTDLDTGKIVIDDETKMKIKKLQDMLTGKDDTISETIELDDDKIVLE